MRVNQDFILSVFPDALFRGNYLAATDSWAVDSRVVQPGDTFVAIGGSKTDGHAFLAEVYERGVRTVMVATAQVAAVAHELKKFEAAGTVIVVPCPMTALLGLAAAWRSRFSYPVIGITGSVGKTTTKEMIGNIFKYQYTDYLVSQGNQNTLIGLSLNMLRMRNDHAVALFELGINKRGEMAHLAAHLRPTMAVITALGHGHMEGLGSLADIAVEKRDIFKWLPEDGIGIIDGDQPLLALISYRHPVIRFGRKMVNQVQARKVVYQHSQIQFQLKVYDERATVTLATEHEARVHNALAAATVAHTLKIPLATICRGLETHVAVQGRFAKYRLRQGAVIIDDSYNANPESMKAALQAFEQFEGKQTKIAVLGDMLELGINAPFWHRQVGRFLRKVPSLAEVIFVGDQMKWAHEMVPFGITARRVSSWEEVLPLLEGRLTDQVAVLVKASRGIGLSNVVTSLTKGAE